MLDVIIVGGSVAGLSAALVLGRARRTVVMLDSQQPRNAQSPGVHNFLSRDGILPAELRQIGRDQLKPYPSVEVRFATAEHAQAIDGGFVVTLDDGSELRSRKLLIASGVIDELPLIEGMAELWGSSVFHCPYCHGWEVRDQPLAVLVSDADRLFHVATLLQNWSSDLVVCTNGEAQLSPEQRQILAKLNLPIREDRLVGIEQANGQLTHLIFDQGEPLARSGLLIGVPQRQRSQLPAQLGCEVSDNPQMPNLIKVQMLGQTSVPGVYAAGDATAGMQQAINAAAGGAMAGAGINHELIQDLIKQL
ncbi:NAD(P)/FAD-dependent oxidoreductase [Herpetosiphon giganteus]|uniref:NAD(P)/FAD-dependent oxidoreductase n=1 Tax=Herpetosiphon giganteus TaxID=2029754 RepID=UPI00195825F4|nr:NAD(P)/FAD-dependent oxidoreductase [Herpetosiphon giganteus]MBM7841417.1 thioredoxin reductase [Herpetosiphon giganteus]